MQSKSLTYLLPVFIILNVMSCNQVALKDESSVDIKYQFVNLKSAKERRQAMEDQLKLAKVNFQAIDAVVGKELSSADIEKLVTDGIYDETTKKNSPLAPGELGIYLSTLNKAITNAIANEKSFTVTFEDDVVVPYDVDTQFRQALKAVPADWDILYLGCYQGYLVSLPDGHVLGPYTPTTLEEAKNYRYPLCDTDESHRVYGTPWIGLDGGCIAGMFAYTLRPESARRLLSLLTPMREAVDLTMTRLVGDAKIKAYCLKPELARVNTTIPSTIR